MPPCFSRWRWGFTLPPDGPDGFASFIPCCLFACPAFTWESTIRRTSSRARQSGWSRHGWPIYPASESRSPVGHCDGWTQIHRSFIVLPSLSPIKSQSSSTPPLSCCVSSFFIVSAESPISRIPSNFPLIQSSDRLTLPKPGSHGPGLGQIHHYQPRGGLPNAGCARRRHSPASTGCTA